VKNGKVAIPDPDQRQAGDAGHPPDLYRRRGFARTGSIARSVGAEGRFGGMMGGLFGRR
jgi:hypothetical protein